MVKRKLITSILIFLTLLSILLGPLNNSNSALSKKETFLCGNNSRSINYDYWGNEVNLSAIDGNGTINPEIAVYKNNIHVIWEENYNIYYRRSVDYGINWSDIKLIASSKKYNATSPTLTIEAYNIYVAWVNVTFTYEEAMGMIEDIDGEIYYRYSLNNGLSWSNDIEIIGNHSHFPCIEVENNKIHIVWSKNDYGLTVDLYTWFNFEIYYMNFTTSSSGTPTFLSDSVYPLYDGELPGLDLAVENNNLHVVWKDRFLFNGSIRSINSSDSGASWSDIKNITFESYKYFKFTSIEADEDNVYVSFIECIGYDRSVGFINSSDNGVTWSNYTIFDKNAEWYDGPDLTAVDGKIFLVWANNSQNQIYLKTSFDYCQNWSENIKITNSINGSSTPKIGVGDNYTHIVMLRDPWPREIFYQNNYPIYEIKLIPSKDNITAIEDLLYIQKYSSIGAPQSLMNWIYQSNANWLNWGASNHTLYGIPSNDDVGQYWVRINISYNNDLFDEHNFTLTVQNVNDPPEIIGAPSTLGVKALQDYQFEISDYVFDIDNNKSELTLFEDSNYATVNNLTIIFNYTETVDFENITIKIWDGIEYSNDHTVNVTVIPPDVVLPIVLNMQPQGKNISVWSNISLVFSKQMNKFSVENAISIIPNINISYFEWISQNTTLTFYHDIPFDYEQRYEVYLSSTAIDWQGNNLDGNDNGIIEGSPEDDYSWEFVTEQFKPISILEFPGDQSLIATPTPILTWSLKSELINETQTVYYDIYLDTNLNKVTILDRSVCIASNITGTSYQIISPFETKYYWTVIPHIDDNYGYCLSGVWEFTMDVPEESRNPFIISTEPSNYETNVQVDTEIKIIFSKKMNQSSVENDFTITPFTIGDFKWESDDSIITFFPTDYFPTSTNYSIKLSTNSKDYMGNPLDSNMNNIAEGSPVDDYKFSFTTADTVNLKPIININSPKDGSVFNLNDTIYFGLNATDPDGDHLEFIWVSNISGILSTKSQFITNLSQGHHQITVYVNDGNGHNVSESIGVIVIPWNRPPIAVISSPLNNQKFNVTDIIHFDASNSTDPDNDYLVFSWHSNISGNLGQLSKFSTTLPVGHHVITLFVNDGFYHTVNRSINIYVLNGSVPSTNDNGHPLKPPGTESGSDTLVRAAIYSGIITIILIVILTVFVTTTEIGKYGFLGYVIPLYSRLKGKKVLNHETRGMIRGYVIANPGDHYNSIKRNLGLKNGSLTYHLKVLEREEIVKSERDGVFKRFYPKDERIPADIMHVTKIQESILNEIIDNPGITQKGLAGNIGVSHQVVNYHIKKLVSANLVKAERLEKITKYYPVED